MILLILELLCIIPLTFLWLKADANKINEETAFGINVAFIIVLSILNWFLYTAYSVSPILQITSGIFEGDLNIIGLITAILPPLLSSIISYIIFLIIIHVKYKRLMKKREKR